MLKIVYMLQDAALTSGASTAITAIHGMYYDSSIGGIVIPCTDGSFLVKKSTVDYYAQHLKEFIEHAADESIVFVAIVSMGSFMRVPPGNDVYLHVHGHKSEFESTPSPWDTVKSPAPKGPKGEVSRMQLHGM